MESFQDPNGFQGNQQSYQQVRADSSRLESYRQQQQQQQNRVPQNYEAHEIASKDYYSQQAYPGYGSGAARTYFGASKQLAGQQPASRAGGSVSTYGSHQSGPAFSSQYQKGQAQKWQSQNAAMEGLSQYGQEAFKGTIPSGAGASYLQQHMHAGAARNPSHSAQVPHFMHQPHHKQMLQHVSSYVSRSAPFNHSFQPSSPSPSPSYSAVQDYSQGSRSYETYPSPQYDRQSAGNATTNPAYGGQGNYGYKAPVAKGTAYEQNKAMQLKPHSAPQYHAAQKLHLVNQSLQIYYQPEAPVKSPEQFYQNFSPTSSHSPVSTVVRSPSYSSTPSPLMSNPEALQFSQKSEGSPMASEMKSNSAHLMPSSPMIPASNKPQGGGSCKGFLKEKIPEKLLSDASFSSLYALSSQVENLPKTVQQLLLSNTLAPQKKSIKRLLKKSEMLSELKSSEDNLYSEEPMGTPQTDLQEDYSSGSDDQAQKMHFLHCRNAVNLDALKKNLDSILSCSVSSPSKGMAECKSDDSMHSGDGYLGSDFDRLPAEGTPVHFTKEEIKASSVIILKDTFKEKVEAEVNHFGLDKEAKGAHLNFYSNESCFGHLAHPKGAGQDGHSMSLNCNQLVPVKREDWLGLRSFDDEGCTESQLLSKLVESSQALHSLASGYKDSFIIPFGGHPCLQSSPGPQGSEKLFNLPSKRGKEQFTDWDELEADFPQCQKKLSQSKFQGGYKDDSVQGQMSLEKEGKMEPGGEGNQGPLANRSTNNLPSTAGEVKCYHEEQQGADPSEEEALESKENQALREAIASVAERKSVICDVSPTRRCAKGQELPPASGSEGEEPTGASSVIHAGRGAVSESPVGPSGSPQGAEDGAEPHPEDRGPCLVVPEREMVQEEEEEETLPTLSPELISTALTEIENAPLKSPVGPSTGKAATGRLKRLPGRAAAQGGEAREGSKAQPPLEENEQGPRVGSGKPRWPGANRDRTKPHKASQDGSQAAGPVAPELPSKMCTRSSAALMENKLTLQSRGLLKRRAAQAEPTTAGSKHRPGSEAERAGGSQRQSTGSAVRGVPSGTRGHTTASANSAAYTGADLGQQVGTQHHHQHHLLQPPPPDSYKPTAQRARTRAQATVLQRGEKPRKNGSSGGGGGGVMSSRCLSARSGSSVSTKSQRQTAAGGGGSRGGSEASEGERVARGGSLTPLNTAATLPVEQPLKRKAYYSLPPVPAKRQHQQQAAAVKGNERTEDTQELRAESSVGVPAEVQGPGRGGTSPARCLGKEAPPPLSGPAAVALQVPGKTKILPPRKGRGLKLEAIVQKITSPNAKSGVFACSNYSDTVSGGSGAGGSACLTLDQILALKEASGDEVGVRAEPAPVEAPDGDTVSSKVQVSEASKAATAIDVGIAASDQDANDLDPLCRKGSKMASEESARGGQRPTGTQGEPVGKVSSPYEAVAAENDNDGGDSGDSRDVTDELSSASECGDSSRFVPAAPAASSSSTSSSPAAAALEPPLPPPPLAREDADAVRRPVPGKCLRQVAKRGGGGHTPSPAPAPAKAKKDTRGKTGKKAGGKAKASGSAGGRRRRKHLKGRKSGGKAARRRKAPAKRSAAPLVETKEPEIRLKYVSYKVPRTESRAQPFSPYVHVQQTSGGSGSNGVDVSSSVCAIVNTLSEQQSRLQKVKKRKVWCPPRLSAASLSKALPVSSAMLPGPVVLEAATRGHLLCCLCGRPKNHRQLGDLFGPYYPEDYTPPVTKSQHLRARQEVRSGGGGGEGGGGGGGGGGNGSPEATGSVQTKSADWESERSVETEPPPPPPPPPPVPPAAPRLERAGEAEDPHSAAVRTSSREKCKRLSCYCCVRLQGDAEVKKAKRRPGAEDEAQPPELPLDPNERWVHGACAVWTSGIYLAAGKLYGLREAMEMASEMRCCKCEQSGATLGCYNKGCLQKYHYICAMESGCQLSEENFSMKCSKHKGASASTL